MIIDCHAHLVPVELLEALREQATNFPSVRMIEQDSSLGFSFAGHKPTRPVSKSLSDVTARLTWMDAQKIDRQVVGGWLDMFAYEIPRRGGYVGRGSSTRISPKPQSESRVLSLWPRCRSRTGPGRPKSWTKHTTPASRAP